GSGQAAVAVGEVFARRRKLRRAQRNIDWLTPPLLEANHALFQNAQQLVGGLRAAEQIALRVVAAVRAQELHLLLGLGAFGDDLKTEAVGKLGHADDDRGVVRIAGDV